MSDRYFVDTNILMYAHDTAAGDKHARARALVEDLWENRSGVVRYSGPAGVGRQPAPKGEETSGRESHA